METIANAEVEKTQGNLAVQLLLCCFFISFGLQLYYQFIILMVPEFPWSSFYDRRKGNGYDQCLIYGHPTTSQFQPEHINYYMSKIKPKGIYFVHCIIIMCLRGLHIIKLYLLILDINLTTISRVPFFNYTFLSISVRPYKQSGVSTTILQHNIQNYTHIYKLKLFQFLVS